MQERINKKKEEKGKVAGSSTSVTFSTEKVEAMKNLAQQIAKSIGEKPKSQYQKELEEERKEKLELRSKLKSLTPVELRELNRKKTQCKEEDNTNKYDDVQTKYGFDEALTVASRIADVYNHLKNSKLASASSGDNSISSSSKCQDSTDHKESKDNRRRKGKKSHKHKRKSRKVKREENEVDDTGMIDGEHVDGLLKTVVQKKKIKDKDVNSTETQDNYVLETLLSKKG